MGILRNKHENNAPIRIEDYAADDDGLTDNYTNYLFDSDFTDSDNDSGDDGQNDLPEVPIAQQQFYGHRRNKKLSSKRFRPHRDFGAIEIVDGLPVKRNMGAQKWRRVENAKIVAKFADAHDICFDGSDLMPDTITAFTRLLQDEAKMKMWNEFIEKEEMEQMKIIQQLDHEIMLEAAGQNKPSSSKKHMRTGENIQRKSADENDYFLRLDKRFRDSLMTKRRHIPFHYLHKAELLLRKFFMESPSGTYLEHIASRLKRFYMHAVAQFLRLKSQTCDGENSAKVVHVNNEGNSFTPPEGVYLASLIRKKRWNHRSITNHQNGDWEDEFIDQQMP